MEYGLSSKFKILAATIPGTIPSTDRRIMPMLQILRNVEENTLIGFLLEIMPHDDVFKRYLERRKPALLGSGVLPDAVVRASLYEEVPWWWCTSSPRHTPAR